MRSLLLAYAYFWIPTLFAGEADSLSVAPGNVDSARCMMLNDLCLSLCYTDPDSALDYGREALQLANRIDHPGLVAISYNRIGIVYDITGAWDTSIYCYRQAASYALSCGDTVTVASAYNNMGLVYWNRVEYDKAIDYYQRSLGLFQKKGKLQGVANTLNNISLIYWEQGELQQAIDYQHQSLAMRKQIDDQYGIGASLVNLGMLYSEIDSMQLAKQYLYSGIRVKEKNGNDAHGLAIAYNNLGIVLHESNQDDSAIYCYKQAAGFHLGNDNPHGAASTYLNLGELYRAAGNNGEARKYLLEAQKLEEPLGGSKVLITIYDALAASYRMDGQLEAAAGYYDKRIALNDSLYNADKYEKLVEIEEKYESEKKDREIAELNALRVQKDLETAEDKLQIANQEKWLGVLGAGLIAVIVLTLLIILFIRAKNQKEKDRLLVESKEKSLVAIFEATERERQRIAKDLHDGIGQQLSGLKLAWSQFAEELKKEQSSKEQKLDQLTRILDESASELREISHEMMPRVLSEMGLVPALQDMLEKSLGLCHLEYSFDHYNLEQRLDRRIEITLFRVAQELTNNIIKHSGASRVNIQVFKNRDHVILIMEDNGRGVADNLPTEGHGFTNIRSRLDVIHGTFNLEPSYQSGTVATVRVSLI